MRDRLVRLGIPLAAFTVVLWPLLVFALREPIQHLGSYWYRFTHSEPFLDNGPLWFLGVLLIYSLAYAGRWQLRSTRLEPLDERASRTIGPMRELRGRHLIVVGAGIAAATFVVRLQFPLNTPQVGNLHIWEWSQCAGMFALGTASARWGWLQPIDDRPRRGAGVIALAAALSLAALIVSADALGLTEEPFLGGWGWPTLALAAIEGAVAVAASVWLLAFAQRRLDRQGPFAKALARSSYADFVLQGPVLIGLALLLRTLDLPAEIKAVVVASVASSPPSRSPGRW